MKKVNLLIPVLWLGAVIYLMTVYGHIPNQVGTHYGYLGTPDQYGSKASLWSLPLIFMLIWGVITLLIHYLPVLEHNIKGKNEEHPRKHKEEMAVVLILVELGAWVLFVTNVYYLSQGQLYLPPYLLTVILTILLIYILWLLIKRVIRLRKK
ncbi:MAG: DUF1648 domain-containing protein [Staphylococcus rostri]|uniref:DUF1648 domain-containing protein n=1 Tax=Staphylococcus rostri TaxID=522262 RepID=UPI0026DEAB24|nr:DUF1648 domain-containing protein [Staphylococcus rostri]MDO5376275.1 DUF1648 domain-containing protein [Staphylococcus rostri]